MLVNCADFLIHDCKQNNIIISNKVHKDTSLVVNHKNGTVIIGTRADEMSRRRAVCHGSAVVYRYPSKN